jgi:hypothetical protein
MAIENQEHKEHWFRKHAEAIPLKCLPVYVITAIQAVLSAKEEDKLSDIEQIIEIYEDILKEGRASGKQG